MCFASCIQKMHCFRFWTLFSSRNSGTEGCDVGRVAEGIYSYIQKDNGLWVDLEIIPGNKLKYLILSKNEDRFYAAHTEAEFVFDSESCRISFAFDSTNSEALSFPDASSSRQAECEIPATKHEGSVVSRSRKLIFGDKKFRFSKLRKASLWSNVVMFANWHRIRLTHEDLQLLDKKVR